LRKSNKKSKFVYILKKYANAVQVTTLCLCKNLLSYGVDQWRTFVYFVKNCKSIICDVQRNLEYKIK